MVNNIQDINLFEKYEPEKPKPQFDLLIVLILAILVIGGILFFEFDLNINLDNVKADIEQEQIYLKSAEVSQSLKRIQDKKELIAKLEALETSFVSMDSILRINGIVHVGLFSDINLSVPQYVYITNLTMSGDAIRIQGYADSYKSVGEFEHNIRSNARFSSVSVPSITNTDGNFSFSMDIVLNMEV